MPSLIRLAKRAMSRRNRVTRDVALDSYAELAPFLYWASDSTLVRFRLPPRLVRTRGAFAVGGGWHPFASLLTDGEEGLRAYFRTFQPRSLAELYLLPELAGEPGASLSRSTLPWLASEKPPAGVEAETRSTVFYGPATQEQVDKEIARLRALHQSISRSGYRPDRYGDVTGYFMKRAGEIRFVVKGGTHRAVVACANGVSPLPVTFKPNWPRLIDLDAAPSWPLVADGTVSRPLAEAVFSRYFDFDGTQQRLALERAVAAGSSLGSGW